MSDPVTCPGCGGAVDRDEHLLCPACHSDLTAAPAAAPSVATVERPVAAPAALLGVATVELPVAAPGVATVELPVAAPAPARVEEAARAHVEERASTASAFAPGRAEERSSAPDGDAWRCASPGCEHAPALPASVAACPYCLEPRPSPTARFELRDEARAIVVALAGPGPWRLGRDEPDTAQLSGCMTVSRSHALLSRRAGDLVVRDLGSSNGTFVGGVALAPGEERVVEDGSSIGLGKTVVLRVHCG